MIASRLLAWLVLACLLTAPGLAVAQGTTSDRATAEALFREAKRLMDQRKFGDACPKLEESQRLDPQGGTLLNLAVCHAREGKTASAWAEFQEALALAREAKRNDRITLAKRELAKLSPRLSHLVIDVPAAARVPGLEVRRGSTLVGEAAWGVAVPVDPGSFSISAKAPGYRPWSSDVEVAEAERASVKLEPLEKLPPPKPKAKVERAEPSPKNGTDDGDSQRTIAYVAGGVGVVALGVGTFFGLRAIDKASDSDSHCDGSLCDREGVELNDAADQAATVSNVAMAVGLVGIGVGTYLFVTAGSDGERREERRASARSLDARAAVGASSATILLSGAW